MSVQAILALKGQTVTTGTPSMTVGDVARTLADQRIGAIVVVDEGQKVCGIISERDVVRVVARGGMGSLEDAVSQHMTQTVVTCSPRNSVSDVMELMTRGRFRHVPVIDSGRLVGIISIGDVVKHRMAEIEREADQIRQYIATA